MACFCCFIYISSKKSLITLTQESISTKRNRAPDNIAIIVGAYLLLCRLTALDS